MKKIYQVLSQIDAYICQDWFESRHLAQRCADQRDGKEEIINTFFMSDESIEASGIYFSDSEYYTESEWEIIDALGFDDE